MKACLLILLLLSSHGSILVSEELDIQNVLSYTLHTTEELPDDLSVYDAVVISTPSKLYTDDEINALKQYVHSGGGLMLLAEENNQGGSTIVINTIAEQFSIFFNTDRIYDDKSYTQHTSWVNITPLPKFVVFQGINTVVYTSGCSLTANGVIVRTSPEAYAEKYDGITTYEKGETPACMAFVDAGKGRVFACGDQDIFDTYMSLKDNTLFALNVFDWVTGNTDAISHRLNYKRSSSRIMDEVESLIETAQEHGLHDIYPKYIETAQNLLSEAHNLYLKYQYFEAHEKAVTAKESIKTGEEAADTLVSEKIEEAETCISRIEKGAKEYLPSQLEAAKYYLQEIKTQKTYTQKITKAEQALTLCNEIRTGLQGAADKEIGIAAGKVDSYTGLFGRGAHHSARINLEYAQESYAQENYGDAIEFAQQSQEYSDTAAQEQKKDYILVAGIILIGVLLVYVYVRK
ncbi:MAG: hypothetical protein PVF58_15610 [Candidatus Methanofastidiosia archaeon]|jgi:hypothetical protein